MKTVPLAPYHDDEGNRIEYSGAPSEAVQITFRGRNNVARIHADAHATKLQVDFNADNGTFELGANPKRRGFAAQVRVGQDSTVRIADGVSATSKVIISAVEGVTVEIGQDTMFASNNQVRADDGHPIFDVRTGERLNLAQSIRIGAHTWLGWGAIVLAGVEIGEGSVVGANSIVTRSIPNNVIAAGSPATVIRTDIAWERPHLGLTKPFYKPHVSTVKRSKYWRRTDPDFTADALVTTPPPTARQGRPASGRRLPLASARRLSRRLGRVLRDRVG